MAVAIFTPRPNSQDFQERRIQLTESVKIGRSVAKVKSAANNLIFDCKVLSRNHAIIWYEGGKFFLQDTKSSNGTFINNVRLSKGAEESDPKEIFSGDIVQFGVEVVENSKRGAVTHGCIIATLTLFGPDGSEATPGSPSGTGGGVVQSYELWQLSQYIQDALHREQILENKIVTLQRIIADAQTTTGETFESIIQEDKLLTRLETLENHLDVVTKNCTEDELKQEISRLHDDKNKYEMAAKEGLRRITEEKLKAIEKISQLEKSYSNAEDECSHYQSLYERAQEELEDLAAKHAQRLEEMKTLREQLEKSERRHAAADEQMNKERESTNEKLNVASKKEQEYISRLESLQAECDFRKEQLVAMRAQMEKRTEEMSKKKVHQNHKQNVNKENSDDVSLVEETIQVLKEKLQRLHDESKTKQENVNRLKGKLDEYENKDDETELPSLKNELSNSEQDLKYVQEEIGELEEQLMSCHLKAIDNLDNSDHSNSLIVNKESHECNTELSNHLEYAETNTNYDVDMLDDLEAELQNIKNQLCRYSGKPDREELPLGHSNDNEGRRSELILLKCMRHIQFIKDEMACYKELVSSRNYTITALSDGQNDSGEQTIEELRDQLRTAESKASEVKQEIFALRDKLLEEQETARGREETIAQLHQQMEELTRSRSLTELEKTTEHRVAESAKSTAKHMQKQAAISAEKASKNKVKLRTLQEENKFLLQKVQTLESELKWSKKEKKRLTSEREKRDPTQFNHKNSSTNVVSRQVSQEHVTNAVEDLSQNKDSAKRIDVLDEQNSRLKYFLLPVFFFLLAMLVSFAFGIIGSSQDDSSQNSE
ncbi:sarcolemmal membrane-associated protein-like [Dendronephthya gigantea]|uniref:sarcolemmal membrane-associated protein-like n=1 Tax=Dendronephthya gigantea TaxID=151771 RepID=UPI00106DADA7|nr:sarcolemmal membrane-associated protein-like [Dendronephthya gigantea]